MSSIKDYASGTGIGDRIAEVQALTLQIEALESKLDEHKAYLLGHALRNDLQTLRLGAFKLSVRTRQSWRYSDAVKASEAKLKARKSTEQAKGIATATPSQHLVCLFDAKAALSQNLIEA